MLHLFVWDTCHCPMSSGSSACIMWHVTYVIMSIMFTTNLFPPVFKVVYSCVDNNQHISVITPDLRQTCGLISKWRQFFTEGSIKKFWYPWSVKSLLSSSRGSCSGNNFWAEHEKSKEVALFLSEKYVVSTDPPPTRSRGSRHRDNPRVNWSTSPWRSSMWPAWIH